MTQVIGHISQIIGPVVDVHFERGEKADSTNLPSIHDALKIRRPNGKTLIVEVQQHIGEDTVRTIAMDSTDGLQRGMKVTSTGKPITMPVGPHLLRTSRPHPRTPGGGLRTGRERGQAEDKESERGTKAGKEGKPAGWQSKGEHERRMPADRYGGQPDSDAPRIARGGEHKRHHLLRDAFCIKSRDS